MRNKALEAKYIAEFNKMVEAEIKKIQGGKGK
jgi:hypothetical protein